jgi:hypothetical protein
MSQMINVTDVFSFEATNDISRIADISSSPWFHRIWTVQEFLLARNAVFLIGHTECPATPLYSYVLLGEALSGSLTNSRERQMFRMRCALLEQIFTPEETNGWLITITTTIGEIRAKKVENQLAAVVRLAAMSEAADERDKVYGVLSLVESVSDGMIVPQVQYTKTVTEVFEKFTHCMIRSTGSLWPLEIITGTERAQDLPSWVLDMRDDKVIRLSGTWPHCTEKKVTDTELNLQIPMTPSVLNLMGRQVGTVAEVHARMPIHEIDENNSNLDRGRSDCLSEWMAITSTKNMSLDMVSPIYSCSDGYDYNLALADLTPYLNYIRKTTGPETESKKTGELMVLTFRRDYLYDGAVLLFTKCGLMGTCKGDVQVGDEVYMLLGAKYPMVVRRIVTQKRRKMFRFIAVADVVTPRAKQGENEWFEEWVEEELERIVLV